MPNVKLVKRAYKARPSHGIKPGDSYYMWRTRDSHGKSHIHYSKTEPNELQASGSDFLQDMGNIEALAQKIQGRNDFSLIREQIISIIRKRRAETERRMEKIPYSLRINAPSVFLMKDRAQKLDEMELYFEDLQARIAGAEPGSPRMEEILNEARSFRYDAI
jgi:hypothetical protein